MVHIAGVDNTTYSDISWNLINPAIWGGNGASQASTTTTLSGATSGAGLVLTAAVSPSAAAGTVTFSEGTTVLGTVPVAAGSASVTVASPLQGAHHYTASFAPTDATAYAGSSGSYDAMIGITSSGQITLNVAAPVVDGSSRSPSRSTLLSRSAAHARATTRASPRRLRSRRSP